MKMIVNGEPVEVTAKVGANLLDVLRDHLGLTGTKKGCGHGQCGACTVHVGGKRVVSCLKLAATVDAPVTTIEGLLGSNGELHPMQRAFLEHDAFQCGYCTPGQIMSAVACVQEGLATDREQIREAMAGNLCRCSAYVNIVEAIVQGAKAMEGQVTREAEPEEVHHA
ncbi:MAG: (2Fe-2S)-binding protein [Myxococcota bacterium]